MPTGQFYSHIGQDRWVAEIFGDRKGGFFLDFGAFDGVTISNTVYLERHLGWHGICVEPNPTYFPALCRDRTAIAINAALWSQSRLSVELADAHGLSSLAQFVEADSNAEARRTAIRRRVWVDTVAPVDLLERFEAPQTIEYLSLDVEGCELEVLTAIDLRRHRVLAITVEHNHDLKRQAQIRSHLSQFGFAVVQVKNDDFFFDVSYGCFTVNPAEAAVAVDATYPLATR